MSQPIRFLLGTEPVELKDVPPTQTVLNYLRENGFTGCKEGCAEGDCGACTTVIGELKDGRVHYKAINACIHFMPMLDGKQLINVEHLAENQTPHPVQSALAEQHATQCGFCSPGFVMSGAALYMNLAEKDYAEQISKLEPDALTDFINETFSGNLCRCTGYGPIIEAARQFIALGSEQTSASHLNTQAVMDALQEIAPKEDKYYSCEGLEYFQPSTLASLCQILAQNPQAHIVAGATDLGLWVSKQHRTLSTLVNLGQIPELKTLEVKDDKLIIGASVSYSAAFDSLCQYYPELQDYLWRHSSTQIRNSGTLVGNIANGSPIGDMPPPLIALGAEIRLQSKEGERLLPLEDYFIAYGKQDLHAGEFIKQIELPILRKDTAKFRVYKISKRFAQDISAVSGSFHIDFDGNTVTDARICFGGMAATPLRAGKTENFLIGRSWNQDTVQQVQVLLAEDYTPISDFRASSDYRMQVAQNLLYKFYIETSTQDIAVPIQVSHQGGIKHA
ncbi:MULTISPECIES: xanthine dehydrogenase small subunit [Thiomicrorhabdus]|uniref:Xanthine dehydrogenase small subunit n=1 Tax=Thiomicrorhabdus heinhorstiae TaxID=2748010 RepID=A0ABS0BXH3_9GAMM|nr:MULTISPECIES: xanthine dehydrogenase small subunit [Thiomicrorhabdus]MBF6058492.1 xanthine dehydrogenase small subunit [Thiomicrorhabdus heinhorstiae]